MEEDETRALILFVFQEMMTERRDEERDDEMRIREYIPIKRSSIRYLPMESIDLL